MPIDKINLEVSIICHQAAIDQTFHLLKPMDSDQWLLLVGDKEITLRPEQASAIAALFIGGLADTPLETELYAIAEPAMKTLTPEERMIP